MHPQIHAHANWAVDTADVADPHLRKMSIITTAFNHAGFHSAAKVIAAVFTPAHGREVQAIFAEAMTAKIGEHANVRFLVKHSALVRFIVKLRPAFFRLWAEHRAALPAAYSAEASFLGTVLHSIDHTMAEKIYDPWLAASLPVSARYQAMKSCMALVRCAFLDDLPFVQHVVNVHYRNSPVRFHQEVYRSASSIDPVLADYMQTTIVK